MRPDVINAYVMATWARAHLPRFSEGWTDDATDQERTFGDRMPTMFPQIGPLLISQGLLARDLIERHGLNDVVLLGGGVPTPLSPSPDRIALYTDANKTAVDVAAARGYNAQVVDVTQPDDVASIGEMTVAIGTGLFHFLDDAAFRVALENLAACPRLFLNHIDDTEIGEQEIAKNYVSKMHSRTPARLDDLLPAPWRIVDHQPMTQFLAGSVINDHLDGLPSIYHIYELHAS